MLRRRIRNQVRANCSFAKNKGELLVARQRSLAGVSFLMRELANHALLPTWPTSFRRRFDSRAKLGVELGWFRRCRPGSLALAVGRHEPRTNTKWC
jgi:hypothetical protein